MITFPLGPSPDGRRIVDADGRPVLIVGDAAWSLIANTTPSEAHDYLSSRRSQGFNALVVNLIESTYARNAPATVDGTQPFLTPGDFTTPNEAYLAHAETILQLCADAGFAVFLGPAYLGWPHPRPEGPAEGWHDVVLRNGVDGCRSWGEVVARRLGHFDNIIWQIGGDRNPDEATPALSALVEGLRAGGARGPMVSHVYAYCSALDLPGVDWITFNLTYGYGDLYPQVVRDARREPQMPTILVEAYYEGEWDASPLQVRRQMWASVLGGGCGHVFGNRPVWLFDPGWQGALDSPGARAMRVFHQTLSPLDWSRLQPDAPATVLDPTGAPRPTEAPFLGRTAAGDLAVAYTSTPAPFTVNLAALGGGSVKATWIDPATGERSPSITLSERITVTPPFNADAVLVLERSA